MRACYVIINKMTSPMFFKTEETLDKLKNVRHEMDIRNSDRKCEAHTEIPFLKNKKKKHTEESGLDNKLVKKKNL